MRSTRLTTFGITAGAGLLAAAIGALAGGGQIDALALLGGLVVGAIAGVTLDAAIARPLEHADRQRAQDRGLVDAAIADVDERERTYDEILTSMQEGVLLFAADGAVRFANPAVDDLLGSVPSDRQRVVPTALRSAVVTAAEGKPSIVDVELGTPTRWIQAHALPVGTQGDVLLVVRDVTRAHHLDDVRTDFVANASHELKTPVASIQVVAETLRSAAADDPSAVLHFAERLEQESQRLGRIVSDLLDLSRLESIQPHPVDLDIAALVREEVDRLQPTARDVGITLSCTSPAELPFTGDDRDLRSIVRNLVDNALRYTKEGGGVEVTVTTDDASVVLTVRDTGVGVPQRDIPRLFERFYRVDRARARETGGTGLGLAIVKHAAESEGGTVAVDSELGVGSTFTVRLPHP